MAGGSLAALDRGAAFARPWLAERRRGFHRRGRRSALAPLPGVRRAPSSRVGERRPRHGRRTGGKVPLLRGGGPRPGASGSDPLRDRRPPPRSSPTPRIDLRGVRRVERPRRSPTTRRAAGPRRRFSPPHRPLGLSCRAGRLRTARRRPPRGSGRGWASPPFAPAGIVLKPKVRSVTFDAGKRPHRPARRPVA